MIECLQAGRFSAFSKIRHGFFCRTGGVSSGIYDSLNGGLSSADDPSLVQGNRRRMAEKLGARNENLISCQQIHSPDVVTVEKPWQVKDRPSADAMVTKVPGIALGVLTADCGPVLFADPVAGVIGGAHAGWRGALAGVLENTVQAMEALGARRANIHAAVGPCIWQTNYEVGAEFFQEFVSAQPENKVFFVNSAQEGHFMFDLPGFIQARLQGLGLASLTPSLADTYADERRFFSYRRNCHNGVNRSASLVSAIMLTE